MPEDDDQEVKNIDEDSKKPPKTRVKNAKAARDLFLKMLSDDQASQAKRNAVKAMRDGKPPYDQAMLVSIGQGDITNLDFGEAKAIHEQGVTSMLEIINSSETLVAIPLKKNALPDEEARLVFEQMLASEATRTIREWRMFHYLYQNLVSHWFDDGVGIAHFEDCWDWRFRTGGLGEFVVPRKAEASEEALPYAGRRRAYQLHELWEKIKEPETAKDAGWNVDAVKKAMVKCATTDDATAAGWAGLEEGLLNNDYATSGKAQEVRVIHFWVKEFDGTVSLYLLPEQAPEGQEEDEPFLYEKHGVYQKMQEAFVFFCFGIGNGTLHGITGKMHEIYPQAQYSNRLISGFVDAAKMGGSLMLQPETETDYANLAMASYGNFSILPPAASFKIVEHAAPNLSQNMIPAIEMMTRMLDKRSGQVDLQTPSGGDVERTRYEVQTIVGQQAQVGVANLSLFIPPWGWLMREMIRRLCRPDYDISLPGGQEAQAMRARLREQGFPLELLASIDFEAVTCTQDVGSGISPAARQASMAELEPLAASFDDTGRHNFLRDKTAAALRSYKAADRYVPRQPGDTRPPPDKQIAGLENSLMALGQHVDVVVNQMHTVHLDTHLPFLMNQVEAVDAGEADMAAMAQPMALNHDHCVAHLEPIQADPTIQEKTAMYRQALQQAGEIIANGQAKLEAQARKAQEEGAEAQQQGGGITPEMAMKLEENNLKLDMMREQAELKAAIKLQEFYQKMAMRDAEGAAKIIAMQRMKPTRQTG